MSEVQMIKTLTHESEKINTKEDFFLPPIKQAEKIDLSVSGWSDRKETSTDLTFSLPPINNSKNQRQTKGYNQFIKFKFNFSPDLNTESKRNKLKTNSLEMPKEIMYKVPNFSLEYKKNQKRVNKSVERRSKLTNISKKNLFAVYSPKKDVSLRKRKAPFAMVDDLLLILKPDNKAPIRKKVITTLRSRVSLSRSVSKAKARTVFYANGNSS